MSDELVAANLHRLASDESRLERRPLADEFLFVLCKLTARKPDVIDGEAALLPALIELRVVDEKWSRKHSKPLSDVFGGDVRLKHVPWVLQVCDVPCSLALC